MSPDQVQQIVDAENKRLNEIALAKATARLQDIAAINKGIERLQGQRAELQSQIAALQFDTVTAADVLGTSAAVVEAQG